MNQLKVKSLNENFKERYKQCKIEQSDIDKANCLYELLRDISELQDNVNLSIPIINEGTRFTKNITDNANSLFLDVSKYKGNLRPLLNFGYFEEKVNALIKNYNEIIHHYNLSVDNKKNLRDKLECKPFDDRKGEIAPQEVRKYWKEKLFKNQDKLKPYRGRE